MQEAKTNVGGDERFRMPMAARNKESLANSIANPDLMKEFRNLRQDINIVAQHIVVIRKEMQEKATNLSNTADSFEQATHEVLEAVLEKINEGELDVFSSALSQIVKEDSEAQRKKLFEDIERAILAQQPKAKSNSISLTQWLINALLLAGIAGLFFFLKG